MSESLFAAISQNPIASAFNDVVSSIAAKRDALGLSNPGTLENLSRECSKDVFLAEQAFTGMRADISKSLSISPLFQISHALAMGSQQFPPYTLATMFGDARTFLHANVDNEGALSGRFHYRWSDSLISKVKARLQSGPGSVVTIENEYQGKDFTMGLSAYNPSLLDGGATGVFVGYHLQSITPNLALGIEGVWQRQAMSVGPEAAISYVARYATKEWIATAQLQAQGVLQASYWRRIADKIEAGADVQLMLSPQRNMMGGRAQREGVANVGVKYDFRNSSFRTQIDSNGKVSCLLEKRLAPTVSLTFFGDMDHFKNQARLGCLVSLDIAGEELMEQQEKAQMAAQAGGPSPVAPPF